MHFRQGRGTRKVMKEGEAPVAVVSAVPRISRLMALAIRMQELVDTGEVADYANLARLAHVSRARIIQIMSLTLLAPDIQEAILFLPATDGRCGPVGERPVRRICVVERAQGASTTDSAAPARLAHVSRTRISQIMSLTLLTPEIQEAILFLPRTDGRRGAIGERQVRPICAVPDWRRQRRVWGEPVSSLDSGTGDPTRRPAG